MSIEIMLYSYLFICAAMIAFNIVMAVVLKKSDEKTVRVSENFKIQVQLQLSQMRLGKKVESAHKLYLQKKLKKVGNMLAFDKMLEEIYIEEPELVQSYLSQLDSVLIALTVEYCRHDRIEAAYFPYLVKKYRLIANRVYPSVVGALFDLLKEPSIYCRENAMQALYTTGDADCVLKAIKLLDKSELFFHGKLLADGLLNFSGNLKELDEKIVAEFSSFSVDMQVTLLNYMRFSTGDYADFAFSLLQNPALHDEIHYACIRYLGKYYYPAAYPALCELANAKEAEKWEYAAIASTALVIYPGAQTVELLKANLYSSNWYIRFNSAQSLERLGVTYAQLADVMDGNDRFAAEILRYRLQREEGEALP